MELLATQGHTVRAATRSADKPLPKGVERVSSANLGEVMQGAEKLFLLVSPAMGPKAELDAIAAAKAAGVKHVVKLSSAGAGESRGAGQAPPRDGNRRSRRAAWTGRCCGPASS